MYVGPVKDGCWFCGYGNGKMYFTTEWDAYFHENCLIDALMDDPFHPEATIINSEFDYKFVNKESLEKWQNKHVGELINEVFNVLAHVPESEHKRVLNGCLKYIELQEEKLRKDLEDHFRKWNIID